MFAPRPFLWLLCLLAASTSFVDARGLSLSESTDELDDAAEDVVDDDGVTDRRARAQKTERSTYPGRSRAPPTGGQEADPDDEAGSTFAQYVVVLQNKFDTCPEFRKYVTSILGVGCMTLVLAILAWASTPSTPTIPCVVVSERKVGVLSEPNIASDTVAYIETGVTFTAVGRVVTGDNRVFYRLANKRGWVPRCSRKDETKTIVDTRVGAVGYSDEPSLPRRVVGYAIILLTVPVVLALVCLAVVSRVLKVLLAPLDWLCPCGGLLRGMDCVYALPSRYVELACGWSECG